MRIPKTPKHSASCAALFSFVALSSFSHAQIAVDFGGDYNEINTIGGSAPVLIYENGDFDSDSVADDRRGYNAIDTQFPTTTDDNNVGKNLSFKAGFQATYFNLTSADPLRGIYRFQGSGQSVDKLQVGSGATGDGVGQTFTFAPNIPKSDFLNGLDDTSMVLSFANSDSIVIDTSKQSGTPQTVHAIVKNGSDWFISESNAVNTNVLTINGFTETWYPYTPDINLIIPALTGGVAGSALTDIQAVGLVGESNAAAGEGVNASVFLVNGLTVLMDQSAPSFPPTTPVQVRNTGTQFEDDISDNVHTLADFRVIDAADSKLVVAVGGENTGDATSVTYGGVALVGPVVSENSQDVSIWYLDDPVAGDADIVVTLSANKESRIVALSLGNAADGIGSSASGRDGGTVQLDIDLATVAPNTLLVGAFVNNGAEISSTPFGAPGETVVNAGSGSSSMNVGYTTQVSLISPPTTFSWVNSEANRCAAVLIGISPVGEVGEVAPLADLSKFKKPVLAVPPTIDGIKTLGEWGDAFQIPMVWPALGALPNIGGISFTGDDGSGNTTTAADATEADISAVFSYKWDATNLYILAEVKDDVFIKPAGAGSAGFPNDHFLLAIDPDVTADGPGSVFLSEFFIDSLNATRAFYRTDVALANPALNVFTNHSFVGSEISGGYIIELALNWADLGVLNPMATDKVGVSMLLVDNDAADNGRDVILISTESIVAPSSYHQATLSGPLNSFENFISSFNVGVLNQPNDDADSDGLTNDYEWKFGGNPAVSDVAASNPVGERESGMFFFKYNRRLGATALGLTYTVEADSNLSPATWQLGGLTETGATTINEQFEKVTVETPFDLDKKFIRVRSE